jgi:hypothetical protein
MVLTADKHPKVLWGTNLGLWLKNYWLASQVGCVDSDYFIIHNVPLFLADSA